MVCYLYMLNAVKRACWIKDLLVDAEDCSCCCGAGIPVRFNWSIPSFSLLFERSFWKSCTVIAP